MRVNEIKFLEIGASGWDIWSELCPEMGKIFGHSSDNRTTFRNL